jgi:threonine/homoserine/homoserine lactone efflux protein
MLYVIARSLGQGRRAGFVSALGLSLGYLAHTLLAASGLAALLVSFPAAYAAVRVAGALYLVYLGVRTLHSSFAPPPTQPDDPADPPPPPTAARVTCSAGGA